MEFEEVMRIARKIGECFQRRQLLDKVVVGGVFVLVALTVTTILSRIEVFVIFVAALCGGGWAGTLLATHDRIFTSRQLLPFLPDLVDRFKEKRKHAGLSILQNFGADLGKYSVNGHKLKFNFNQSAQQLRCGQNVSSSVPNSEPNSPSGYHLDLLSVNLPETVDEEIQHLIKSVMRDFVLSWYSVYVSDHSEVSEDLLKILLDIAENISSRLELISKRNLLTNFLVEFRTHVHRFHRARSSLRRLRTGRIIDSSSMVASYETFSLMHPAIQDKATETDYLKSVMRVLLHSAVPRTLSQCHASTAILVEILTCNVLLPLLNLLADPDFLYRLLLLIVSSAVMSSSRNIEVLETETADKSKPKKPTCTGQRGLLHQENIDIASRPDSEQSPVYFPFDPLKVSTLSQGSDNQQLQTRPKSVTVNAIFEPRSEPNLPFQSDHSHADPSFHCGTEILPQLVSKDHSAVFAKRGISPSSIVPISRYVDALVVHSQLTLSHSNQSVENLPSSCSLLNSGGHRRTASDSSLNPAFGAFIPGNVNHFEVPSTCVLGDTNPVAGPSAKLSMPRPPTEGAESNAEKLLIPMTALEPAMTETTLRRTDSNDGRPRSCSAESFSSIDFDTNQLNMRFSDIDYQFAFEGNPRGCIAATGVVKPPEVSDWPENKRSESSNEIGRDSAQNRQCKEDSWGWSRTRNRVSDEMPDTGGTLRPIVHVASAAKKAELNQPPGAVGATQAEHQGTCKPDINVTHSSTIKNLLRRVSFSKKNRRGSEKIGNTSAINAPVSACEQSAPILIPVPVQMPTPASCSSEQNRSPPLLTRISPAVSFTDEMRIPTAENPRIISISAPETLSKSEPMMGFNNGLMKLKVMNLTIPTAEVCKEVGGKGEFFLYSIQFDVLPNSSPSSSTENLQRPDTGPVHKKAKRRHREFVNLHSRLEHNPQLKLSLKGIRDIPKRLSIPLAPTAKSAIDQRRIGHQHYLQQLLARPLLHSSAELAEFLALEGNTHIEYVRHQPREYVPRIDKLLRNRVSGLVDTIKHVKSALPRALSDIGPLPPMSPPTSPIKKSRVSQQAGKTMLSPPGSPRPGSPSSFDEHDSNSGERIFAFDGRPKTTLQLAMGSVIEDHSCQIVANFTLSSYPASATNPANPDCLGPRSEGDGCESPDAAVSEMPSDGNEPRAVLGSEEVSLFDSVMCLLGEAFYDKKLWFLDEGFQSAVTVLAGGLFDGWIERQVNLLLSEHWCAFYLAELREVLWPDGKLLSASKGTSGRTETDKEATRKDVLAMLVDLMPEPFYQIVNRKDWQDGLELLLDSLGDPQLNRHLVFTALDLLMDALISEIKDESFQRDLLSRI